MADSESNILIVDDDKQLCSLLKDVLKENYYNIYTANDAQSVLNFTSLDKINLALIDLHLPDIEGQELIKHIHNQYPSIEFIIITGSVTPEIMSYAVRQKYIVDCIQKPIATHQFKGFIDEILRRQKIEKEAKESEDKYRDLYENSPDMYVSVNAKTSNISECNQTLVNNTGYTKEEILNMTIFDLYHPDSLEIAKETFYEFQHDGQICNRELELKRKDGSKIYVMLNVRSIRDNNGNIVSSRSSWRDITDWKKSKDALIISERRFKGMFDHSTSGVAVYTSYDDGETFVFLDMNSAGEKITQTPKKDLIGKNLLEVFPGCLTEDFDLLSSFRKVWKTGKPIFHPSCLYRDDRIKNFWPENSIYKLSETEMVAIFNDVTEYREAKDALEKERYFLKKAQEIGKIGTWEIDLESNTMLWTEENHKVFGIPEGTPLTYEIFLSRVHPDDRKMVDQAWRNSLKNKDIPYALDHRVLLEDGSIKWIREKAELQFQGGKCIRAIGFSQDITDLKQAENAQRISLLLKTALLDNMEEVVLFFKSPDMTIEWANKAAARLINQPVDKIKGQKCYKLFTHRDTHCETCPVLHTFQTGKPGELLRDNDNGQVFLSKTVKLDANGMSGVMEISTDVTTEVRLQEFFKEKIEEWVTIERENHIDLKKEKLKLNQSLLQLQEITNTHVKEGLS